MRMHSNNNPDKEKSHLIYPDLSYRVIGILFNVFNELGYGYPEKYYQKARDMGITFSRVPLDSKIYISKIDDQIEITCSTNLYSSFQNL